MYENEGKMTWRRNKNLKIKFMWPCRKKCDINVYVVKMYRNLSQILEEIPTNIQPVKFYCEINYGYFT